MRVCRTWDPKHYQLFVYLKTSMQKDDITYNFIAEVMNREFNTDEYHKDRLRNGWFKFQTSGKPVMTDLIKEYLPDAPEFPRINLKSKLNPTYERFRIANDRVKNNATLSS